MKSLSFTPDKDAQLQHLLQAESQADCILRCLFQCQAEFVAKLQQASQICESYVKVLMPQPIRKLVKIKLYDRLSKWQDWSLFSKSQPFGQLIKFTFVFCFEKQQRFDILALLLQKVQEPTLILDLLQKIFVVERESKKDIEQQSLEIIKQFLKASHSALKNSPAQGRFKEIFQLMGTEEKKRRKLQIIRIFSQAFFDDDLSLFQLDTFFVDLDSIKDYSEVQNLISINCQQTTDLIKSILSYSIQEVENGYGLINKSKIDRKLLSTELLKDIFEYSTEGHSIFMVQFIFLEAGQVIYRYNFTQLSQGSFSNILPHSLIKQREQDIYEKQSQLFLKRYKEILQILTKINDGWKLSMFRLDSAEVAVVDCDRQKTMEVCLQVWSNILKTMELIDDENNWQEYGTYRTFHKVEECKPQFILSTFQKILTSLQAPTTKVLKHMCFILRFYRKVCEYPYDKFLKNKAFFCLFNEKIKKLASMRQQSPIDAQITQFFMEFLDQFKEENYEIGELAINHQATFKAAIEESFHNQSYQHNACKGPRFFRYGLFESEKYTTDLNYGFFNYCPEFKKATVDVCYSTLRRLQNQSSLAKADINRKIVLELSQAVIDRNLDMTQQQADTWRNFIKNFPRFCLDIANLDKLIKKINVNIVEEERVVMKQVLLMLGKKDMLILDPKVLIDSIWTDDPQFLQLSSKLSYWYLLMPEASRLQNPDLIYQYREALVLLKQLLVTTKERIIQYLATLDTKCLQRLLSYYQIESQSFYKQILAEQAKLLICRIIQNLVDMERQLIYNFIIKDHFFIELIQNSLHNGPMTRSFLQIIYKCLNEVARKGKETTFGLAFYYKHKEKLQKLLCELYVKWDTKGKNYSDRSDDCNFPSIDISGIEYVISSKEKNQNSLQNYKKQIEAYVFANVQELLQSIFMINTCSKSAAMNNKLYFGSNNLVLLQKSVIVDILQQAAVCFKPEYLKYYNFILSKSIGNIQNLQDYIDRDTPNQIVQSILDTQPPTLSVLDVKDCDLRYSQAIINFIRQLIDCSSDQNDKEQLIQLLINAVPHKETLQYQRQTLLKMSFSKCQEICQKEPYNLKKLSEELRWFTVLCKDVSKEIFLASIDINFLNRLLASLSQRLEKINVALSPQEEDIVEPEISEKTEDAVPQQKKQENLSVEGELDGQKIVVVQQRQQSKEPTLDDTKNIDEGERELKNDVPTKDPELKSGLPAGQSQLLVDPHNDHEKQNEKENFNIKFEKEEEVENKGDSDQNQSSLPYLEKMLPLLSRLVPDFQEQHQPEEVVLYAKNILSIIVKIVEKAAFSSEDYFQEIAAKIALSCNDQVLRFANYFIQKSGANRATNIICQMMQKKFDEALMESDLKAFFLKKCQQQQKPSKDVEIKLDDLANAFMRKYAKRLDKLRNFTLKCVQKFTNSSHQTFVRYIPKQDFDFCCSLGCSFIDFKVPLIVRSQIQHITTTLAQQLQSNTEWLQTLQMMIFYCPILIPTILFQTVTNENNKTLSFLDLLIKVSIKGNQKARKFIGFICQDHASLIRGKDRVYFISQFICFRIVQLVGQSQLTPQCLLFVFCLLRFKTFAGLCNCRILKDSKALRDLVEQKLVAEKKIDTDKVNENSADNGFNIPALIVLAILYRYEHLSALSPFLEKKKNNSQSGTFNIGGECTIDQGVPFAKIAADRLIAPQEIYVLNEKQLLTEMEAFAETSASIQQASKDRLCAELDLKKDLQLKGGTVISSDIMSMIGCVTKVQQLDDIPRQISNCMTSNWRSIIQKMIKWENEQDRMNNTFEGQSLLQPQEDDSQAQTEEKENHQPTSTLQPSRFAVEDYALQPPAPQPEDQEGNQQNLLIKFLEAFNKDQPVISEPRIMNEHQIKFTQQMLQIISNINSVLSSLGKPLINLAQCEAQTEEGTLDWLKNKQIETEFDFKEANTGTAQFEAYCLSNALRLERLPSAKRNKVKLIEEHMLQTYLQRTVSGDEIDYLIDTIDQNYQQLSKLERRLTKAQDVYNSLKPQRKKHFLSAQQIPKQVFSEMSEELLWKVVLSFYQQTVLIQVESLVPFLQNKTNRDKLLNTLLFVLRNPFETGVFPKSIHHFCEKNKKSPEDDLSSFKLKALRFILSLISHGLYTDERYLVEQVDYQGLKGIILEPIAELAKYFSPEKHVPIVELVLVGLSSNLDNLEKASLLRGLQHFPECILSRIFSFINQLNTSFTQISNAGKGNARLSSYYSYRKQYKSHLNFATLLRNAQVKEHIRQAYPISEKLLLDPFMFCLFMDSDVFSPEEYKQVHSIILKREKKKDSDIFFCGQVVRYYSEQQLRTASWLRHDCDIYVEVFERIVRFLSNLQAIAKEPIFKVLKMAETLHFKIKSQILSIQIKEQKNNSTYKRQSPQVLAKREKGIFQSAFEQLRYEPDGFWRQDFDVKFVGLDGKKESGYGGGVAKEWYTYVTKGMVNLNYGLFTKTSKNYYYINRQSWINPRHLQFFEFIGKIFALSIINPRFLLAPRFSIIIYKAIIGQEVTIKDIIDEFDEGEVISNLEKMRQYTDDSLFCESFVYLDKGLIADTKLTGSINQDSSRQYLLKETEYLQEEGMSEDEINLKMLKVLKVGKTIELLPGGRDIPVTKDNLEDFIRLTKQKIYEIIASQAQKQINAFIEGVRKVISLKYLKKFTAAELRELAEGADTISVEDIKKHAKINITKNIRCLQLFWEVLEQLVPEDKIHFIHHWTGIPKISAEGIEEMNLQIRQRSDDVRIFAHTCFNRIYLPPLQDKEAVREAVLLAVNSVKQGMSIIED